MERGWYYWPNFINEELATRWLCDLRSNSAWVQGSMRMYGKELLFPRLMAWYGTERSSYRFSGKTYQPNAFTPLLTEIKDHVEQALICHAEFSDKLPTQGLNSVLLNWYRQGQDSMSWHSDDEPELGSTPFIASLSLGASRWFHIKPKNNRSINGKFEGEEGNYLGHVKNIDLFGDAQPKQEVKLQKIYLEHGSLLLMFGDFQRNNVHALPKTKQLVSDRINLTFRTIFHHE